MKPKKVLVGLIVIIVAVVILLRALKPEGSGNIRIDTPNIKTRMSLRRGWWSTLHVSSGVESVEVTARKYRPRRISLAMQKDRNEWIIDGFGPWGELAKINVKAGKTTVLKPGPPLLVKTNLRRKGQNLLIGLVVVGQAGEYYRARVRTRRGTLPAPGLKIVDEGGKVLVSDKFTFG